MSSYFFHYKKRPVANAMKLLKVFFNFLVAPSIVKFIKLTLICLSIFY